MSTRDTTAFLQDLLEQQLSIEEGLNSKQAVIRYVGHICDSLEEVGYEVPEKFALGDLLKAIEEEVLSATASLDEDLWGDQMATQKKKSFLGRAVGAVKGAVKRGVTAIHTKMRRYHAAKASAALDKAADPASSPKEVAKADKQHTKHYVKQQAYAKKLNPASAATTAAHKQAEFGIKHGSAQDAAHQRYHAKKLAPLHTAIKADHPMQANASAMKRKAAAQSAVTQKNHDPEAGTKAMRIKPVV